MIRFVDETVLTDYDKFVDIATSHNITTFCVIISSVFQVWNLTTSAPASFAAASAAEAFAVASAAAAASELVDALSTIKAEADTNQEISRQLQEEVKRFKNI